MQLQILFTDDTAWMNLIDSRYNKSFQVEIAKSKEIPLYFAIDDDGQIFGGASARNGSGKSGKYMFWEFA